MNPVIPYEFFHMYEFQVVSDSNLADNWRQLGLEAIVTLSETAPGMVRKLDKLIQLLGKYHLRNISVQ